MCGIYGSTIPYSDEVIDQKLKKMGFRGPDNREFKRFPNHGLTLGHVRLSIVDLDSRSNQPYAYSPYTSIVFNGEIYNYQTLAAQFLPDVRLCTSSDTEVLCALYEKMGERMLAYLNGMFSFVIYDSKRGLLWGARDRLGLKPFYYRYDDAGFEFASQISALSCGNQFNINPLSRQLFLLNRFVPDPYSIYTEISKLRAGQTLTYCLESRKLTISQYWDIMDNSCGFAPPKSYPEALETLHSLIADAVRIRLHADVPIGLYLSGGIDSSLVAAMAVRHDANIKAYTIGFNDAKFDESIHAQAVATHLGINLQVSKCQREDLNAELCGLEDFFDEPFADNSVIPSCLLAHKSSLSAKVVLGGDGGDEQFMGYGWYQQLLRVGKFYHLPVEIRRFIAFCGSPFFLSNVLDKWKAESLAESYLTAFHYNFYGTSSVNLKQLCAIEPDRSWLESDRGIMSYGDYDIKHFLNSDINTKTDRSSMRYSQELRSPLLDYRITEYSRLLPYEFMYNKDSGVKRILKDILFNYVPQNIIERPKQGFESPIGLWLRTMLKDKFLDTVSKNNVSDILPELDPNKFIALRDRFLTDRRISPEPFWRVYSYINWYHSTKSQL